MMDRTDEVEGSQGPPRGGEVIERVAVVAKLRPGSRERASQILAEGAPYDLGEAGFRRHSIFLAEQAAVFVFEGSGVERLVRELVDDPTRSAAFSAWGPLLAKTPTLAPEEFYWEAGASDSGP
ncbi:MAG TPA: hypothetical protein VF877_06660 [Gaiellaceae bacterium]